MPEDRAAVAVWQDEQDQRHHICGTFEWEWEEDPSAWTAGVFWCLGCRDVQLLRKQLERDYPDGVPEGYTIRLYKGLTEDDDGV